MAKVIVERPRHGSRAPTKGKGYNRRRARVCWEDQPIREGMTVRGGKSKWLNEHLSPLRRYLVGQVGQHWDKVFADICRYLDRGSAVQDHVRDHLDDYVAARVTICDGQLCHGDGYHIGHPLHTPFYVCPRTKILRKNRRPLPWRRWDRVSTLLVHFLDEGRALVRMARAWYMIDWRIWQEPVRNPDPNRYVQIWDELLRIAIDRQEAIRVYGKAIVAIAARRACKREIRPVIQSYPSTNRVH